MNIHLDSFTFDTNALPLLLQISTANTFYKRLYQKRQRWFLSASVRLHKHLEEKTAEVIFDKLTKDPILDRKNLLDRDGAIVESAHEGGDNRERDKGIIVKHTNQLIMNTNKSVDFCKRSMSAKHSCVSKDCKSKENLNVFEMASITWLQMSILKCYDEQALYIFYCVSVLF